MNHFLDEEVKELVSSFLTLAKLNDWEIKKGSFLKSYLISNIPEPTYKYQGTKHQHYFQITLNINQDNIFTFHGSIWDQEKGERILSLHCNTKEIFKDQIKQFMEAI